MPRATLRRRRPRRPPRRASGCRSALSATHRRAAAPASPAAPGFWLQLGAFRDASAAEGLKRRLSRQADWLAPWLSVFGDQRWHRVQAGPYASATEASSAAERLREALRLAPVVV